MNKQILKLSSFLLVGYFFIFPQVAQAVVPPDFIFSIGTQIAQFSSIMVIFASAIFGAFFQFFKTRYYAIKHKKTALVVAILLIIVVIAGSSYLYAIYKQNAEYEKWLNDSNEFGTGYFSNLDSDNDGLTDAKEFDYGTDPNNPDTDGDSYLDGEEVENGYNPNGPGKLGDANDNNNQLNIGGDNNQNIDTSLNKFVSNVDTTDGVANFINEYYKNIAEGNLELAYEMSKQSVSRDTFRGWYLETTKITLDNLVRIDITKSSIELTLFEGDAFTRYGVLMTLNIVDEIPVKVEKSEVKILAEGTIRNNNIVIDDDKLSQEYDFFSANENKNIIITNKEFQAANNGGQDNFIVLDARENIEYENGHFDGSQHIRFADLKAGQWIELPKDKFVYVLCWAGIRGKEVAEFLRTKKIVSSYLEDGANGWVAYGGDWTGGIKFGEQYKDIRYQKVFSTSDVKKKVQDGVVLVDTREPYKFYGTHIAGSVNIPIMYTPTINLESVFGQIPSNSKIITVCDGYVNCFDAKLTGVEAERRGHEFLGRYNKPWEYEK